MSNASRPSPLRGVILIGLAAVSWGTTGSVTTVLVARADASPLLIGAARMWLASIVLLAVTAALGSPRMSAADRWRCVVLGAFMAAFQASYFTAVMMTGIAIAALIAICSAPLLVTALAAPVLGERITARVVAALALGVAGTALLVAGPRATPAPAPRFLVGAALALVAGASYALYVVFAKSLVARAAPLPLAGMTFTSAALFLTPALFFTRDPGRQIALGWPWLLYLGLVTTAAAYALYTTGLRHLPASATAIVSLLEPLTATLLGIIVFGERLGVPGATGALLLLSAITLVLARRDAAAPASPPG